ncbi:MAG: hypothetical protein H6838_01450 [Planctomycetes bacterium]|nr:hypothetical protein [Planctomycetota bacterium]
MAKRTRNQIESPLRQPGGAMAMTIGAVFTVVGLGLCVFWRARLATVPAEVDLMTRSGFRAHGEVWVLAIVGIGFVALGTAAVVAGVLAARGRHTVGHTPDDDMPEVSRQPLTAGDTTLLSVATHRFADGRLEPDPRAFVGPRRFVLIFTVCFGAFMVWLLTVLRPLGEALAPNLALAAACALALAGAAFVFLRVFRAVAQRLPSFSTEAGKWRVEARGEVLASGAVADLVAVQLLAARLRLRSHQNTTIAEVLELNLAWRTPSGPVERVNLARCHGSFVTLARPAAALADHLDLPLLYQRAEAHQEPGKGPRGNGRRTRSTR